MTYHKITHTDLLEQQNFQRRSAGYNAFEKDFAIINVFFGDATAMGKFSFNCPHAYCIHTLLNLFKEYERSQRMTIIDFISSLGGVFGLFLGFSLISFVEIIYWFCVVLVRRVVQGKY